MNSASYIALALGVITLYACSAGRPRTLSDRTPYLTDLERGVLEEVNLARSDPQAYAKFVADWLPYFNLKRRTLPGQETVWTTEGIRGVEEALEFLDRQLAVGELRPALGLSKSAQDHVDDLGPHGGIGHVGFDDSDSTERITRYGTWYGKIGEVICYGAFTPRHIVIQWIVDDGVPSRAHRTTLFDPDFIFIGIGYGEHAEYGSMCVVTFAKTYIEDN